MNVALAIASVVLKELCRRKDFYVLFVLTALITVLLGSVSFFDDRSVARYLKEICLLLIWISSIVIGIMSAARQIPTERENRTIFPLLAKPVTRGQLILGKFLGCWVAAGLALLVFYGFFAIIAGTREQEWPWLTFLQAAGLHWVFLAVTIALALFGSIVFAAPSSNATICFVAVTTILILARHLNTVALQQSEPLSTLLYIVYYLIPHLEFFDIRELVVHNAPPRSWAVWSVACIYGLCYATLFLWSAWITFRRKSLS